MQPNKKSKLEHTPTKSAEQLIYESLAEIWLSSKNVHKESIDKIEVEVRVGMLSANSSRVVHAAPAVYSGSLDAKPSFVSGIDESLVEKMHRVLSARGYDSVIQPLQRLRFDAAGSTRVDIDSSGQATAAEQKKRLSRNDLALPSYFYDIRVDAAVEEQLPRAAVDSKFNWHTERHKRRTSFTPRKPSYWRVDLTEVETFTASSTGSTADIELEFEMLNSQMISWISCPDENFQEETTRIVLELQSLVRALIPGNKETAATPTLVRRPNAKAKESIMGMVRYLRSSSSTEFLGSMPVNLTRRSFNSLRQKNYFVTEKSDGLRYLLFVVNGAAEGSSEQPRPIAVLMDRSGELVLMQGAEIIGQSLGVGTVLDGELVFNLSFKLNIFLVFDVLSVDRASKVSEPFSERIRLVGTVVMQRCKQYIQDHWSKIAHPGAPTILVRKDFLPKQDIPKLLSKVIEEDGSKVFFDPVSGGRRHHRSDGIILQPSDTSYVFGTDTNLLKWKWPELISVDLAVLNAHDELLRPRLLANGPDGAFIDCAKYTDGALTIGKFDAMRLQGDMLVMKRTNKGPCIAEFVYDTTVGLWTYFHVREDKVIPNHISTVLSVLMEQAESVSIDELHYVLLARSDAENDYQTQIKYKKKELLDFQIRRTGESTKK